MQLGPEIVLTAGKTQTVDTKSPTSNDLNYFGKALFDQYQANYDEPEHVNVRTVERGRTR